MPAGNVCPRRRIRVPQSCKKKETKRYQFFNLEVLFDWNNCGYGYVLDTSLTTQTPRRVAQGLLKNTEINCSAIVRDKIMKAKCSSNNPHMLHYISNLEKKTSLKIKKCHFYDSNVFQNYEEVQKVQKLDFNSHKQSEGVSHPGYVSLREGPLSDPEESLPSSEEKTLLRILVGIRWRAFLPSMYTPLIATISDCLNFVRVPVGAASPNLNEDRCEHTVVLLLIDENACSQLSIDVAEAEQFSDDLLLLPLFARGQRIMGIIDATNEDVFTGCVSPSTFLMCLWKLRKNPKDPQSLQALATRSLSNCGPTKGFKIGELKSKDTEEGGSFEMSGQEMSPSSSPNSFNALLIKGPKRMVLSRELQAQNFFSFELFWGPKNSCEPRPFPNSLSRFSYQILHKCYPFFVQGAAMKDDLLSKFKKCGDAEIYRNDFVMEPLKNLFRRMQMKKSTKSKGRQAKAHKTEQTSNKRLLENEFDGLFFQRKRRRLNVQIESSDEFGKMRYIEVYVTPEIYHSGFGSIDYKSCSLCNNKIFPSIDSSSEFNDTVEIFETRRTSMNNIIRNSKLNRNKNTASLNPRLKARRLHSISDSRRRQELTLPPIRDELGTFQTEWSVLLSRLRKRFKKEKEGFFDTSVASKQQIIDSEPPKQTIKFVEHAAKSFSKVITAARNRDSGKLPIPLSLVFEKVLTVDHVKRSKDAKLSQSEKSLRKANESSRASSKLHGKAEVDVRSSPSFSRRASILVPPFDRSAITQKVSLTSGPRRESIATIHKARGFAFGRSKHNDSTKGKTNTIYPYLDLRSQVHREENFELALCLSAPGDSFSSTGNNLGSSNGGSRSFFSAPPSPLHTSFVKSSPAYISALNPLFSIRDVENPDLGLNLDMSKPIDVYSLYYNHLSCPLPDGQLENLNSLQDKKLRESCSYNDFKGGNYFSSSGRRGLMMLTKPTLMKMDRSVSHESEIPSSYQKRSSFRSTSMETSVTCNIMDGLSNELSMLGLAMKFNPNFVHTNERSYSTDINSLFHTGYSRNSIIDHKGANVTNEIESSNRTRVARSQLEIAELSEEAEKKKNKQSTPIEKFDCYSSSNANGTNANVIGRPNNFNFYSSNKFDRVNASTISFDGNYSDYGPDSNSSVELQSEQNGFGSVNHQLSSDECAYALQIHPSLSMTSLRSNFVPRAFQNNDDLNDVSCSEALTCADPCHNTATLARALSCSSCAVGSGNFEMAGCHLLCIHNRANTESCSNTHSAYGPGVLQDVIGSNPSQPGTAIADISSDQSQYFPMIQGSHGDCNLVYQPTHTRSDPSLIEAKQPLENDLMIRGINSNLPGVEEEELHETKCMSHPDGHIDDDYHYQRRKLKDPVLATNCYSTPSDKILD